MEIFSIIICLFGIGFFSSLIVAYTYSNKIFLNLESKKENLTSYTVKILSENPRLYISSLKAGNTILLVIFSFYYINQCQIILSRLDTKSNHFGFWILAISIAAALLYLFSKFIPQTFIKPFANQILLKSDLLVKICIQILSPITKPLLRSSDFLLSKILNLPQNKENQLLSISELGSYITKQIETSEHKNEIDTELQILKNALSFTDVLVKKVMVPKLEIESINIADSIENVIQKFTETGYSRLLVYENSEDNIVGYIHIFEILENPTDTKNIVYPIEITTEETYIKDLFKKLSLKRKSIAKVISKDGNYSGIITMEDIIEELFGEIDDEHDDHVKYIEKQITSNKYIFSARVEIEQLNKKFNINIHPSEEYKTINGILLHYFKRIPQKNETIKIKDYTFKILSATNKKIEIVEVTRN